MTTRLVAVSPQVRDDLVALGVAPAEKFSVVRLGIELGERVQTQVAGAATRAPGSGSRRSGSWSAGSAG